MNRKKNIFLHRRNFFKIIENQARLLFKHTVVDPSLLINIKNSNHLGDRPGIAPEMVFLPFYNNCEKIGLEGFTDF
jgi:hypothetical protein